jgi:adenylate cyclase
MADFSREILEILASIPEAPRKWTAPYLKRIIERLNKRIGTLDDRIGGVTAGRTMPSVEQVAIGSGRHLSVAVLFLDISGFTSWPSSTRDEQKRILWTMDVFMAEMMNIIQDHDGVFEKNTGDGLMAYFGTETSSDVESVRLAGEASVIMHYISENGLNGWFAKQGLPPVKFRIGIDFGEITVARIGIHGTNTFVAIGSTANIANRLLRQLSTGICIGNEVYKRLPRNWSGSCAPLPPTTGFVYSATNTPYPIWELRHRLTYEPTL